VVEGDEKVLEQVRKQLQKLVHVIKAWGISPEESVEREHALFKIQMNEKQRGEILQIITAVQARIVDSSDRTWILEVTGDTSTIDNAFNLFKHYKILESIRTGKISLERGSGRTAKR
jgi:acetolactate synthase-1/3 small subunit